MFIIVDLQTADHIKCFMVCLGAKVHVPGSSNSLVVEIKLKSKENLCTAATALFYILKKTT
jgi:hypothetical protein